ncbi:hypothetical protein PUN28_004812 [Cardiocondyla obscurior]|uniref:Uncharacterized protein n=1 Tax=Cardiocondyla obscurior TaxID=286306 RepID=A0AAW2GEL7_9HYME
MILPKCMMLLFLDRALTTGSQSIPRSRIALTFFKSNVVDNFNADSINAPISNRVFLFLFVTFFLTLCTLRSFIDCYLLPCIHRRNPQFISSRFTVDQKTFFNLLYCTLKFLPFPTFISIFIEYIYKRKKNH